jgi:hypothetical protein
MHLMSVTGWVPDTIVDRCRLVATVMVVLK